MVAVGSMIFFGWLLAFYCELGFWGANIGILIAELLWFLEYFIYFNFSRSFESYWQNIQKNSGAVGIIEDDTQKETGEAIFEKKEEGVFEKTEEAISDQKEQAGT